MGVGVVVHEEDLLEERAAGGEDEPVGEEPGAVLAQDGHVRQVLAVSHPTERRLQIMIELVPLETELLTSRLHVGGNTCAVCAVGRPVISHCVLSRLSSVVILIEQTSDMKGRLPRRADLLSL